MGQLLELSPINKIKKAISPSWGQTFWEFRIFGKFSLRKYLAKIDFDQPRSFFKNDIFQIWIFGPPLALSDTSIYRVKTKFSSSKRKIKNETTLFLKVAEMRFFLRNFFRSRGIKGLRPSITIFSEKISLWDFYLGQLFELSPIKK